MTINAQIRHNRMFVRFGATLGLLFAFAGCGRDGYVVVKEAKTPHRAFDLPTFGGIPKEEESQPLTIIPIETPDAIVLPPLAPNLLPLKPRRAAKNGNGVANLSVTFNDSTGDRFSKFPEGSVRECAIFKEKGDALGQKMFLYAHLATAFSEVRIGLDVVLYDGKLPLLDPARLTQPLSDASWTLRPVLHGRTLLDAKDSTVDAEGPPMWGMDISLRQQKLDSACRASATVKRTGDAPKLEIGLSCGKISESATNDAMNRLDVFVACDARETMRVPFFPAVEKKGATR